MYDPNQPRIPEGHHGGGRWTRSGYGFLSDVGELPPPPQHAEDASRAPDEWDREPDDLHLLSDLDRLPLGRSDRTRECRQSAIRVRGSCGLPRQKDH